MKNLDTYGNGQSFGEFAVAFCRLRNIDIDTLSVPVAADSVTKPSDKH